MTWSNAMRKLVAGMKLSLEGGMGGPEEFGNAGVATACLEAGLLNELRL